MSFDDYEAVGGGKRGCFAMRSTARSLLVATAVLFTGPSAAEDPGRFATTADVVGFWKMLPLQNAEQLNKVNPYPLPYQWFGFYEDGTLASMHSTNDATYSRKQLAEVFNVVKEKAPKFSWSEGFMVVRYPSLPGATEHWGVNLVTADIHLKIVELKPGDLIMTLAGGDDGGPVYYRVLRRVPETP